MIDIFLWSDWKTPIWQMRYGIIAWIVVFILITVNLLTEDTRNTNKEKINIFRNNIFSIPDIINNNEIENTTKITKLKKLKIECKEFKLENCSFIDYSIELINEYHELWNYTTDFKTKDGIFYISQSAFNDEMYRELK